jgi:hypothetical protein
LGKLLETVSLVRQRINPRLRVSGVVLCLYDAGTKLAGEIVDDLNKFLTAARSSAVPWSDAVLFNTRIRRNIKLAEAASFGICVFDYDARSHGALDYQALASELIAQESTQTSPANAAPRAVRKRNPKPRPAPQSVRNNERLPKEEPTEESANRLTEANMAADLPASLDPAVRTA